MTGLDTDVTQSALFPDLETQGEHDRLLDRLLQDAQARVRQGRVSPEFDARRFTEELSRFDFSSPMGVDQLLPWVIEKMRDGNVQITHPRYFGLFNPAPAGPALLAERIVAAFNPQLASAKTSPAAVALEAHVISRIAQRAGLPVGSAGHFTNSGSEANFTALVCALTAATPAFRENGARAFRVPPAIYISKEAHQAWLKIAHQAGIGRLAVRMVPTDGQGRMSADALRSAVMGDIENGVRPVMVVATAGTTIGGMIDPMTDCAEIAGQAEAWFHVDAAWGGAALLSGQTRSLLNGIELADSVTIDAHKWFATTMACGMFIAARPAILSETFGVSASFMPGGGAPQDPYSNSALWSRRFLGLRLFMNLAVVGWQGYAHHIERTLMLTQILRNRLEGMGWTTANPDSLGVLCMIPPRGFRPVQAIVDEILNSGLAWISAASHEGREVVRICITNGRTDEQDIEALAKVLEFYRDAVRKPNTVTN